MKTLNNNQLQEIFNLFASKDEMRPVMMAPFEDNGYIIATDAHTLVRIKREIYPDFPITNSETMKSGHLFNPENHNEKLNISLDDLEKFKTEKELVENGECEECSECEGDGEVEWEYGRYSRIDECPKCDGSGIDDSKEKKVETGNLTYPDFSLVKIKNKYFSAHLFDRILRLKEITGSEIILKYLSDKSVITLQVGDFECLIMEILNADFKNVIIEIV